jgi:hypothetical protein
LELTTPENCTAAVPAFVIVRTAVDVDVAPMAVFGNAALEELSVNCGDDDCTPVPVADRIRVPALTVLMVIWEERLPASLGVN